MIMQSFENKTLMVLNYRSILGRLLLHSLSKDQITINLCYLIELDDNNNKGESQHNKFMNDNDYFNVIQKKYLQQKMVYIPYNTIRQNITNKIDICYNLFIPVDFTHLNRLIHHHIITSVRICEQIKLLSISHLIQLSSIYCLPPGYNTEQKQIQNKKYQVINQSPKELEIFLQDNFDNQFQAWQWTILFIEFQYRSCAQYTDVIRLPVLGPTFNHYQGYSYKFTNFTYMLYQIGNGFIRDINGNPETIMDMLPADYAINYAIVLGALKKLNINLSKYQNYQIHNLSTSSRNSIKLQQFINYLQQAWMEYNQFKCHVTINKKKWKQNLQSLQSQLPMKIKKRLAIFMEIKSWKIENNRQNIILKKQKYLKNKYQYFLEHEWICQSNKSIDLYNSITTNDQLKYPFNVNNINWVIYLRLCCYSIKKYLLNEHIQQFTPNSVDMLQLRNNNNSYFSDIWWALSQGHNSNTKQYNQIKIYVLSSKNVQNILKSMVKQQMMKLQNTPTSYQQVEIQYNKIAQQMCQQMFSQYSMKSIRMFAWFLHKVFRTIYEKVVIDKSSMIKLKKHDEKKLGPLIVIPTHRSYIDFLIMSYVFFGYGIKCPHIAAAEDFLNMAIIHILLRKSGAFFIKRNQIKYKQLYKSIMQEYISKLLKQSHYLQFFIEGTRSRVGKMLNAKFGMLSIVAKNVIEGKIINAQILPVTINYEKVLEGTSFTYQIMGETKVKQSLSRLIKAADVLKENYGRIYIKICEPINVKQYFNLSQLSFEVTLNNLGQHIVFCLSDNLMVTAPAILATILLMHRKGISDDNLSDKVSWLCGQISSRNIAIGRNIAIRNNNQNPSISISSTLRLLDDIVTRSKKDMFQIQLSLDQNSFVKLFTMTYYRNTLTHIFFQEAIIACALTKFGYHIIVEKGISLSLLKQSTLYLVRLFSKQFILKSKLNHNQKRFEQLIEVMCSKSVIKLINNDTVTALELNGNYFSLYGSLVWPLVQSYWITNLYLFKLIKNKNSIPINKLLKQIQWFAQSLLEQKIISYFQAISFDTIRNAVNTFIDLGFLKNIKIQINGEEVPAIKIVAQQKTIKKLSQQIQQYLKSSYARTIKGILQISQQASVNLDFPFLSKL